MLTLHPQVAGRAASAVADALVPAPALAQVAVEPVAAKRILIRTRLFRKEKAVKKTNKVHF